MLSTVQYKFSTPSQNQSNKRYQTVCSIIAIFRVWIRTGFDSIWDRNEYMWRGIELMYLYVLEHRLCNGLLLRFEGNLLGSGRSILLFISGGLRSTLVSLRLLRVQFYRSLRFLIEPFSISQHFVQCNIASFTRNGKLCQFLQKRRLWIHR